MDDIEDVIAHDTPMPPWPSIPSIATSAYSNITANDNSRIQNGNNFYFHQYYTVQSHGNGFEDSTPHATLKRKRSLADIEANPRTSKAQESLDDVLKKLGKLSLSVRHRKEGGAAERIARRVAAVFEAITAHRDEASWDKMAARQLGKLGATVKWEERFDINSVPQRRAIGKNAKAKRRSIIVQFGHWNISLTTTTFDFAYESDLRRMEVFSALRAEPRHRSSGSALAVYFSELTNSLSTSTIPPTVLSYNTLNPMQFWKVFQIIRYDDLDGLLRLLADGELSIHDCDESGRSLLLYSCAYKSIRCCSFLVDRGVDIDRIEMSIDDADHTPSYITPLQISFQPPIDLTSGSCFDILWQAGADPTLTADSSKLPPLLAILRFEYYANVDDWSRFAYLKEGSPYLDFQEIVEDNEGRGYWLELCSGSGILDDPSILQSFVDKGADITLVDNYGFNCLFVFMSRVQEPSTAREYKKLQCLLDIFGDIYARDATGHDIFAYVNELRDWPEPYTSPYGDCGSYRQDLLYCALKRSKLDVRHNVQPCNRLARYTEWYTPKHYMALCYLEDWDSWDEDLFERPIQALLQEHPLSEEEERIQREMDSLWEWKIESDLDSEEHTQREMRDWESEPDSSHEQDDGSM